MLNSANVFARFHNEEPEFLLPFLVASCTLKHYHCNAKPHQWKVLKPLYETHSILGLIVQSQLEHNHRATLFLNMFAKCIQGDDNGAETTLTSLWSEASVLYRLSSPFVKLDYIGRSCSWYRRYSEHKLEILSADQTNDSLPCYKYIRRNCHWAWFSIPFVASSDVIALEPQFIERFTPGLNSTFNRWSKYSNSIQHCDLSKPLKKASRRPGFYAPA